VTGLSILMVALPAALAAASAAGQDARGSVEQIGAQGSRAVEQISTGARQISSPVREAPATSAAPPQLSSSSESRPPQQQLTSEARGSRGTAQLYTGGRTAQASEALSRPSEGRTGAVAPVSGKDRCDPQAQQDARLARECAAVIERRSAEFSRPEAPQLSPEQRLLVEQRARNAPVTRDAARRLADTGLDSESMEAQGVASLVLRDQAPAERPDERPSDAAAKGLSDATAAIVNAIVVGAGGSPPKP